MTSSTHWLKNAMPVHAPKLICSTGVSNFQGRVVRKPVNVNPGLNVN